MATTTKKTTRASTVSKTTTTSRKPKAPASTPESPAEDIATVVAAEPTQDMPLSTREELKKKELIELAVERSGVKKRDAKPAIEAALAILGETLAEGREVNMRPMGKIKVNRIKKGVKGQVIIARIRQPEEVEKSDPDPLAQAAE